MLRQIDTKAIHQQTIVLNFIGEHKKNFLHPYQFFSEKNTAHRAVFKFQAAFSAKTIN